MAQYLDPKNDLTFKRIFGEHPELLIKFLNAVMPFEPDRFVEEITYIPAEMIPDNPTRKYSIVDVRCRDNQGRQFIIEMQMYWDGSFTNRLVFNAGKAYVRQLKRGEEFHLLQPVYTLAILNEDFDRQTDSFYHHYQIINRENTNEIIPGLEFVLIELTDKFRLATTGEAVTEAVGEKTTGEDNTSAVNQAGFNSFNKVKAKLSDRKLAVLWLRFLKEVGENMHSLPAEMQENEYIRQAAELCREGAYTLEELATYDKYWDIISTEKSLYKGALLKGRAEGQAERTKLKAELDASQKLAKQQAAMITDLQRQLNKNS